MTKFTVAAALLAGCTSQPAGPCADGDTMCMDVLAANVTLAGSTVEAIQLVAELRGPFDDGSAYVFTAANLVHPEYIDDADGAYGTLTRYPLTLRIVPGDDQWHPSSLVQFEDDGTDGAAIAPLCGTTAIAELTLGAPSRANGGPMTSTSWLKYASLTCY